MKTSVVLTMLASTVALAAPTRSEPSKAKSVVSIPPPSLDLRSRCQSDWKRYGSIEVCEDEKRVEELTAFQQARLASSRQAEQSDEKVLKDLGFDEKSAKADVDLATEPDAP